MKLDKYPILSMLILISLISGCASGKIDSTKEAGNEKYEQVAERKLNGNVAYSKSATGDYVLCVKKGDPALAGRTNLEFLVYDIKKDKISFELKVGQGTVSWYDETHVEVTQVPGMIPQGFEMADYATLYNVIDGSSRPKKSK